MMLSNGFYNNACKCVYYTPSIWYKHIAHYNVVSLHVVA